VGSIPTAGNEFHRFSDDVQKLTLLRFSSVGSADIVATLPRTVSGNVDRLGQGLRVPAGNNKQSLTPRSALSLLRVQMPVVAPAATVRPLHASGSDAIASVAAIVLTTSAGRASPEDQGRLVITTASSRTT
jgi:hypothetical protein